MREILFRGKSDSVWIEGSLIHAESYVCILQDESKVHPMDWPYLDSELGVIDGKADPVNPETVGQFTGLYDGTKWEDLTDAEKLDFYHQHYIGEDGMSVRFQHIDDVKLLWKGKKVFEGDIVNVWWEQRTLEQVNEFPKYKAVIEFGNPNHLYSWGWQLKMIDDMPFNPDILLWVDMEEAGAFIEVIGNIHDNPELLEVE